MFASLAPRLSNDSILATVISISLDEDVETRRVTAVRPMPSKEPTTALTAFAIRRAPTFDLTGADSTCLPAASTGKPSMHGDYVADCAALLTGARR